MNLFPALRSSVLRTGAILLCFNLGGCLKKSDYAIVLGKEHIAVAAPSPSPKESNNSSPPPENEARELRPDEISVDGYVMEKSARGTERDPRAGDQEQWIVRVKLVSSGRQIAVRARQAQYEKLQAGDRTSVSYREGKYTGTVWTSEIED